MVSNPLFSTLTLKLTLEGEKESYIADKVKSAEEFMTYTWSLVGVACFLILVTAAAVFGWANFHPILNKNILQPIF